MNTIQIDNEHDTREYKTRIVELMIELIARIDAHEQHDCNDIDDKMIVEISTRCQRYITYVTNE